MTVAILWILVAVSDGSYNHGTPVVIGHFVKVEQCEHVRASTEAIIKNNVQARCIQAEVAILK